MGDVRFTLLGPPEVRHANQMLLFSTRKELALLIYLAVEGRIHSRKKLSELFWPEGDAMHGRSALCTTLLHLRHLLSEGTDVSPIPHLLITHDTLGLDLTSDIQLDLQTLHEAWRLSHDSTRTTLTMPESARRSLFDQLQRATSLARGEFLEGFSLRDAPAFDDWARFQREYWHLRMSEVFDRLCQMQFEAGELEAAIETVNRWLVLAPLHEDAYRRLMRLHFATGDRAAALHAYDMCRAMLASGMQTEPTTETVALVNRMRAVTPPRRKEAPKTPGALSPATLNEGPLLGRTAELSTLIKVYHTAQRGQTQVVFLEGEAGIGKTRLATEFLAWATVEGAEVLQGRAYEAGGHLPYQPLIEALRPRIERENAPDDLLSYIWLAELTRLLPELCDRYPDLPAPQADKSVARNRLFEAVARLGQALAARMPLVLFIDDVQWADAASLDVVHFLARSWSESATPALLLLTLPLGTRGQRPELDVWRAGMEHAVQLTRLQLSPLTTEDILLLLHIVVGEGGKDRRQAANLERFGQWLFAETEGQPFYLMETLKFLLECGALTPRPNEEGGWTLEFTAALKHETVVRGFFPPVCAKSSAPDWIDSRRMPLHCWRQEPSSTGESPLGACARWPISKKKSDFLPWTRYCTVVCCRNRSARQDTWPLGATRLLIRRFVQSSTLRRVKRGAPSFIAVRCKRYKQRLRLLRNWPTMPWLRDLQNQPSTGVLRQATRRCGCLPCVMPSLSTSRHSIWWLSECMGSAS